MNAAAEKQNVAMSPRKRFQEALMFGKPDKIPFDPGNPRESTLARWHGEGLSPNRDWREALHEILGFKPDHSAETPVAPGIDFRMNPIFEEKVLEHKDGHYVVQDWMGAITEISDQYDVTYLREAKDFVTRKWHKFPVESREDWDQIKWRYRADDPARYPADFAERLDKMADDNRDYIVGIHVNGPYWQLREWCGFEGLSMLTRDDPEFVAEMCEFWGDFILKTIKPVLARVRLDYFHISEDMAFKCHPMIGPADFRRFLAPVYKLWNEAIRGAGCKLFGVDSDGAVDVLIPLWIECGVNYTDPLEVAAGNDIVALRKTHGKKIAFQGGVDKRKIAEGGAKMEAEVRRVCSILKGGGYIPSCDHGVPHDISWPNYIEYARLLAKLTGWI